MKKYLFIIGVALTLSACENEERKIYEPEEVKVNFPKEFKDCKSFRVYTENNYSFIMTRCPLSNTTVSYGKGEMNSTTESDTVMK